jgi:flagellar hook assembly protein FlgD
VLEMGLGLPEAGPVRMTVIDVRGRKVLERSLGVLSAGTHPLRWDGRDRGGADAGAGVFWVRVEAADRSIVRQVVRLR